MIRIRPLLVAAAALAAAGLSSGCATVAEGKTAPPIQGDAWIQGGKDPDRLLRERWGLIVFFRTGSETCAAEMPGVLALQKEFGPGGLAVVGVTPAEAEEAALFAQENGMAFPILTDARHLVDAYGIVEINELHTYLVNPPGIVIVQGDLAKAREILAEYMKGPAKPAEPAPAPPKE
jgi:peroxiredoxin